MEKGIVTIWMEFVILQPSPVRIKCPSQNCNNAKRISKITSPSCEGGRSEYVSG